MAPHIIRAWSVYKGIKKLHVHFITLVHTHIYSTNTCIIEARFTKASHISFPFKSVQHTVVKQETSHL